MVNVVEVINDFAASPLMWLSVRYRVDRFDNDGLFARAVTPKGVILLPRKDRIVSRGKVVD